MNDKRDHHDQPSPDERPHQPARNPTLAELLDTWKGWSYRDVLTRTAAKAVEAGEAHRAEVLTRGLDREPVVTPLDALAANHELTSQLIGWQWHAVRAAREAGATWQQIADATGTSAEQARADYLAHIEQAERCAPRHTDIAAYRAVLDDEREGR